VGHAVNSKSSRTEVCATVARGSRPVSHVPLKNLTVAIFYFRNGPPDPGTHTRFRIVQRLLE
jgi:hypothetical protein